MIQTPLPKPFTAPAARQAAVAAPERGDMVDLVPGLGSWLESFAAAVRGEDFEAGRSLFCADAHGFGTRAASASTLDELVAIQWKAIWPNTERFTFELDSASWLLSAAGDVCCVWLRWSSWTRGTTEHPGALRTGRCTLTLVRPSSGPAPTAWLAAHSHFSIEPQESSWERQLHT